MRTYIDLTCELCSKHFQKLKSEYVRRQKGGHTQFFCSRKCQTIHRNKAHSKGNIQNLVLGKARDEWSQFRWFVARARYRDKNQNLTVEFLSELWKSQSGRCPFTNWELALPPTANGFEARSPKNASLDRIDNSKGYIQGNVRFVCLMANLARADFSDIQLRAFCLSVSQW